MAFATSLATKSLKHARNARVANPIRTGGILSIECSSLESMSNVMANCLSPMASIKKIPTITPVRAQKRTMTNDHKPTKGRMTIAEIKAALEPITRAREQGYLDFSQQIEFIQQRKKIHPRSARPSRCTANFGSTSLQGTFPNAFSNHSICTFTLLILLSKIRNFDAF